MSSPKSSTWESAARRRPTPMIAATTTMPNPATTPEGTSAHSGRSSVPKVVVRVTTRAAAISTINPASTL